MRRVNLIPQKVRRNYSFVWGGGFFIVVFVGCFIFAYQVSARQKNMVKSLRDRITVQEEKLATVQEEYDAAVAAVARISQDRAMINAKRQEIIKRLTALQEIRRERTVWSDILMRLSELVPEDIWINQVALEETLITLNGNALDSSMVSVFMARLDASMLFQGTSFHYIQKVTIEDVPVVEFEIVTRMEK